MVKQVAAIVCAWLSLLSTAYRFFCNIFLSKFTLYPNRSIGNHQRGFQHNIQLLVILFVFIKYRGQHKNRRKYDWFMNDLSRKYDWFMNDLSRKYDWFMNDLSRKYDWFMNDLS